MIPPLLQVGFVIGCMWLTACVLFFGLGHLTGVSSQDPAQILPELFHGLTEDTISIK